MNLSCCPRCRDHTATFLVSATVQFVALCTVGLHHVTTRQAAHVALTGNLSVSEGCSLRI